MDEPGLERARHIEALRALARVNRVSGSAGRIVREARRLWLAGVRPVRVLDVACGGGDVLCEVVRLARRHEVEVEAHGCDISPVALEHARERAEREGTRFDFFHLDVLGGVLPADYDLVCSTLFLHHLTDEDAVALLGRMAAASRWSILLQDLRRSRLGFVFAYLGLLTLTRSDVAKSDGLVSVGAAFTLPEARELCRRAGLETARVRACWPQRYTIEWSRPT